MNKRIENKTKIKLKIEELERQSKLIREELEGELYETKKKVSNAGKIAFGIGGGLILSALILNGLSKKRNRPHESGKVAGSGKVYHRFRDQLRRELTRQATNFILGLAKDRLNAILNKKDNEEDGDS
ncbi:MAG: hypothetical protein MI975_11300 [Cytophagales bacterium]|nr:hypothetical protein [Cytophagales bacterium]